MSARHCVRFGFAALVVALMVILAIKRTPARAEVEVSAEVGGIRVPSDVARAAAAAGLAVILLEDPKGNFWYDLVEGVTAFTVHPGAKINARGIGGSQRTLYLKRYVMNTEEAVGFRCPTGQPWHRAQLCDNNPVTGYWETTFTDPMK